MTEQIKVLGPETAEPHVPELDVSVIVPIAERPEDLTELYHEYSLPLAESGRSFEFIFVAEPWCRRLTEPLLQLVERGHPIRVLQMGQTMGEASLLRLAATHCNAPVIVTLPAYRRVQAGALADLIQGVIEGADVVNARRWPRRDAWLNRLQGRVFHMLLGSITSRRLHDVASGVRAMRRDVLLRLPLYGDFFRFLPLLAAREGYTVTELAVPQHERDTSTRIYGPGVYLRRIIDLLGLFFLLRFTEKPLRFFGLLGSTLAVGGGSVLAVLLVQRLQGQGIADRPLLLLGVLLVVLGIQAIALGLVGEIIVHLHASGRRSYRILQGESQPHHGAAGENESLSA
ncbi:MAG: hypothetical protein JSW71_16435 [Gemmatimonadota bacterium]|nr:MAG: hypothetical protein JSW71_16435 [Gemmatimonadota bacterium]